MKKKTEQKSEVNSLEAAKDRKVISSMIHDIRGLQVMLDKDLAALYGVETKVLNQAVKRNIERFPEDFMFQLTKDEAEKSLLRSQVVISKNTCITESYTQNNCSRSQIVTLNEGVSRGQNIKYLPFAFTENGIAMLSSVLRSQTAIQINISIMRAFNEMRHFINSNAQIFRRIETIEYHQLEMKQHQVETDKHIVATDNKLEEILDKMNSQHNPVQGIFYNNQFFDAHTFVCDLIRCAKKRIVLIDNYIDDTVLKRLDKRADGVDATIYTDHISKTFAVDIATHNKEYAPIEVIEMKKSHDRFLIIDDDLYHFGASIKDLGKKIFAFDKFIESPDSLLARL